jgi:hypothetical protein
MLCRTRSVLLASFKLTTVQLNHLWGARTTTVHRITWVMSSDAIMNVYADQLDSYLHTITRLYTHILHRFTGADKAARNQHILLDSPQCRIFFPSVSGITHKQELAHARADRSVRKHVTYTVLAKAGGRYRSSYSTLPYQRALHVTSELPF